MQNESLQENKEIIAKRLLRFTAQLDAIKSGERIFVSTTEPGEYVEITPNVIVRYQWIIEICEFAICLIDDRLTKQADGEAIREGGFRTH